MKVACSFHCFLRSTIRIEVRAHEATRCAHLKRIDLTHCRDDDFIFKEGQEFVRIAVSGDDKRCLG